MGTLPVLLTAQLTQWRVCVNLQMLRLGRRGPAGAEVGEQMSDLCEDECAPFALLARLVSGAGARFLSPRGGVAHCSTLHGHMQLSCVPFSVLALVDPVTRGTYI